jgi:macrodomain Ter protein organizer (MatP/YcbG family)
LKGLYALTNVVVAKIAARKRRVRNGSVVEKRKRSADGQFVQFFTIEGNSATLNDDLTHVFMRNIKHARRENQKLFGSVNGPRKK